MANGELTGFRSAETNSISIETFYNVMSSICLRRVRCVCVFLSFPRIPGISFLPRLSLSLWCVYCRHPQGVISSLPLLWPFRISSRLTVTHTHTRTDTHAHTTPHRMLEVYRWSWGQIKVTVIEGGRARERATCQNGDGEKRSLNWWKNNKCSLDTGAPLPPSSSPGF